MNIQKVIQAVLAYHFGNVNLRWFLNITLLICSFYKVSAQCIPSPPFASKACGTSDNIYITSASISGTTFYSAGSCGANPYTNLSGTTTAYVTAGLTYNLNVVSAAAASPNYFTSVFAWIDWNNDGDFVDAGENIMAITVPNNGSLNVSSGNFTVGAALSGTVRMRIAVMGGGINSIPAIDPCNVNSSYFGEYKDFALVINASASCPPPIQTSAPAILCYGNDFIDISFKRGNGNRVIVLAKAVSAVDASPVNNTVYTSNSVFGSGTQIGTGNYIVYDGNDIGTVYVHITGLAPGTAYNFKMYEYIVYPACYNTIAPATISQTTKGGIYASSTATQNTANVSRGSLAQDVVKLTIVAAGDMNQAVMLNSISFTTVGTTDAANDITNAKIFYTGNSNSFSNATQFGQTFTSLAGLLTANGNFALLSGNNYFWIAYDVKSTATQGNVLDATIISFNISENGALSTKSVFFTPPGSRRITSVNCSITTPVAAACDFTGCITACCQGMYISNATFGTTYLANWPCDGGFDTNGFNDLSATISFTVNEGSTYPLTFKFDDWIGLDFRWAVWIDWNANGDYRDAGERYPSGNVTNALGDPQSITVPVGVSPSGIKMRLWIQSDFYPDNCPYRTTCGMFSTSLGIISDVAISVPNATGAVGTGGFAVSCSTLAPTVISPVTYVLNDNPVQLSATGTNLLWYTLPTGGTGSATAPTPATSVSGTTTYYVSQTNSAGSPVCEGPRTQIAVFVKDPPSPTAPVATPIQPTCITSGSVDLTGLPASANWTIYPNAINGSGTSLTITPVKEGTYSYLVMNAAGCLSPYSNSVVIINPDVPTAPIAGVITQPDCFVSTGSVTLSGLPPGNWTINPGNITGTTATTTISGLIANSTYNFTVTDLSGCTSATSTDVVINAQPYTPTINISATSDSICIGSSNTLTASGANAYTWSNGLGTANPLIVTPLATTTYTVTGTSTECSNTATIVITVVTLPAADAGISKAICLGDSIQIGSSAILGNKYTWTSPSGFTSAISNPIIGPTVATTYTLTETVSSLGCTNSNTIEISVNPLPTADAGSSVFICKGKTVIIGSTAVPGNSYSWISNPTGFSSTSSIPSVNPVVTTTYTMTETITATACSKSTDVVVSLYSDLSILISALSDTICEGTSTVLTASGADTYLWRAGLGTQNPLTVSADANTTYTVVGTTVAGCSDTANFMLYVKPKHNITITPNPAVICPGNSLVLNASGAEIFNWSPAVGLDTTMGATVTVSPASAITYTVTGISNGCANSESVAIRIACPHKIVVPNAFSPNDDWRNDKFIVYGTDITKFNMKIFDRWGKIVYESDDIYAEWDGIYNNQVVPQGVYSVIIKYEGIFDSATIKETMISSLFVIR